eukprot:UC1_evm1s358
MTSTTTAAATTATFLLEDDPEALRRQCELLVDMVRRLESEIGTYHKIHGALTPRNVADVTAAGGVDATGMGLPPGAPSSELAMSMWLANTAHMPPLFAAYDDRLARQAQRLAAHETELTRLQAATAAVVQENEELQRRNADLQAMELGRADWEEMRASMALLVEENKVLVERLREAGEEVDSQRRLRDEATARADRAIAAISAANGSGSSAASAEDGGGSSGGGGGVRMTRELVDLRRETADLKRRLKDAEARALRGDEARQAGGEVQLLRAEVQRGKRLLTDLTGEYRSLQAALHESQARAAASADSDLAAKRLLLERDTARAECARADARLAALSAEVEILRDASRKELSAAAHLIREQGAAHEQHTRALHTTIAQLEPLVAGEAAWAAAKMRAQM